MASFSFKLLGPFQAFVNDQPVAKFPTDKIRGLLVYLLIHADQPLRRDVLMGLFWPEQTEKSARHNLRQSLYRLRQTFDKVVPDVSDPLLTMTRQDITLHSEAFESDVRQVEALLKQSRNGDPALLTEAAELYSGEFMAGFSLADTVAFDEWLLLQREGWLQQIMQILQTLIEHHRVQGESAQVANYAARQIELEPLRESAYRSLMLASVRQGQRNKALAYYEACRRLLDQELAVEPTAETTELYEKIKAEAFPSQAPASADVQIPRLATPLVGRESDILAVTEHLLQPTCQLVSLLGEGGIGKTSLATAVAQQPQLEVRFPNGRFMIQLTGLTSSDYLIAAIGRGMGLSFTGKKLDKEQLWDYCRTKTALLVLDNFEHLIDAVSLLSELIAEAPTMTLLVTSRESLNIKAERRHVVSGLQYPDDIAAEGEGAFSAVALFVEAAQRVLPTFELTPENQTAVYEICQLVQGSPLAIEFAAAWVRLMSCDQIVAQIKQNLAFLASSHRDVPERHQSMLAVFEQSWQLLNDQEQNALMQLSHFRGTFALEAVLTVTQISMIDLASLLDKSMVQRNENGRYALHELLRQFVVQQISGDSSARIQLVERHSQHYLAGLGKVAQQLLGTDASAIAIEIKQELDNIRLAWQTAVTHEWWETVHQSVDGMANYYFLTGYLPEFSTLLLHALEKNTAVPFRLRGILLENLALLRIRQGDFVEAKKQAQWLEKIAQDNHDPDLEMRAGICLGRIQQLRGTYDVALVAFETAVTFYKEDADQTKLAELSKHIGYVNHLQGKFDEALTHQLNGLRLSQTLGNKILEAELLSGIGNAYTAKGEANLAISYYQNALDISRRLNQTEGIASILHNMGRAYMRQDQEENALRCSQEALALNQKLGIRRGIAFCFNSIGIVYKRQQKLEEALDYFKKALAINRELGIIVEAGNNLGNIGNTYKRLGNMELAEANLKEGLQLAEEANHPEGVASHLGNLALLYTEGESWEKAEATYTRAIELARQMNEKFILAFLLIYKARLMLTLQQPATARPLAEEGIQLAQTLNSTHLMSEGESVLEAVNETSKPST